MGLTESYADRRVFVTGHTGFKGAWLAEWLVTQVDSAWPAIATLHDPVFYLSGAPPMLGALTAQLRGRGVSSGDIRTDAWE
jgi:hypothetical protein